MPIHVSALGENILCLTITVLTLHSVWNRLKKERKSERHETDAVEEYEDQAGNIFNKKTYEDLRRQGLL